MNIYKLVKNRIKKIPFGKIDKKGIIWIRSVSPDAEELQHLISVSNIPLEELQETVEEEERPRLFKKNYIELIYAAPHLFKGEGLQTTEIYFYISNNLVITIEEEPNKILDKIEGKCKENLNRFMFESHGQFLFHVLDEINDEFLYRIERIAKNLDAFKVRDLTGMDLRKLFNANMASAYFNQAIIANLEVLNQLKKCHHKAFQAEDRANFNELYIDKLQILDTEKIQRELIMNLINIQSITSTERLNHTMKRLTGLALLIAVPTLVTSMYGMNIPLPFQDWEHSFGIIMGGTVILSFALLLFMHKMEWV